MTYTSVFGGNTIYPSDVSYLAIALDADTPLEWPLESSGEELPAARIIDVTPDASGHSIVLPDAMLTGAGQTLLFNNLSGSHSFYVKDFAGNTLATVAFGEQWQLYLAATTTAAGTWRVFRYGASTATVQPSALAGYGITVTGSTLSQSTPVTTFNSSPRTVLTTERAQMLAWIGSGAGVVNLPSAVTAGNNFIVSIRNSGGGDLTIDPAGSETIDALPTLTLHPGDSASLATDGLTWYTLGLGQSAVFAFDYTVIAVTGGTYTLSGSELNRIAYQFTGALVGSDQHIVVPSTVQQYWVDNATSGAYALYLQTSGGTPVLVPQGSRGIYYCNGTNVVDADTATISLPVNPADGGTGVTSYSVGDILYASGSTTLSKLSDVAVGNALLSGGVGVAPAWGKISLTTTVSGTLPVANGGTGATSLTAGYLAKGNGTSAVSSSVVYDDGANVGLGLTNPSVYGKLAVVAAAGQNALYARGVTGNLTADFQNTGASSYGVRIIAGQNGLYALSVADKANNSLMYVDGNGNIGIGGVTSPAYTLHANGRIASTSPTGGIGYATGAGAIVAQLLTRTNPVTINKVTGAILLVSGSSSTSSTQTFDVFNSTVGADDVVVINPLALDEYNVWISRVFAGGFQVSFQTSGTTVEQPVFKFAVIKAASS